MSNEENLLLLKRVSIFADVPEEIIAEICDKLNKIRVPKGEIIFSENQSGKSAYIIKNGEVIISKNMTGGRSKQLAILSDKELFGETALFSDEMRTANASARTDCSLLEIGGKDFFDITKKNPEAAIGIFKSLLRISMERLERTSSELTAVYEIGRIISSGKNLEEIISLIEAEIFFSIPQAEKSAIFVFNEFNLEYENPEYPPIGLKDDFAARLKELGAGVVVNDNKKALSRLPEFLKNAESFAIAVLNAYDPAKENKDGFIIAWSEKKGVIFNAPNLLLLEAVAGQLDAAYRNIKSLQEEKNLKRLHQGKISGKT